MSVIDYNEMAGRQEDAMLDNFYAGFTKGPYTVGPHRRKKVETRQAELNYTVFTHCVFDSAGKAVIAGTESDCERFAERFNLAYAKHIMTKDIPHGTQATEEKLP